eukprot:TRINITY_DN7025_c0_g1_i1.p1 TRINITY_DN7025_c0_g1~~TRINITY_DN7025_c0_g1_i1.p1  ORF type:complete len:365 (+),score=61.71 TRINITY_DN7025_c0_g1_i1:43-1095(+)
MEPSSSCSSPQVSPLLPSNGSPVNVVIRVKPEPSLSHHHLSFPTPNSLSLQAPPTPAPSSSGNHHAERKKKDRGSSSGGTGAASKLFTYDWVADASTSQAEMFRVAGVPLAQACMNGYNATLFAYGQTGSGKTYTLQGNLADEEEMGLIPRVLRRCFWLADDHQATENIRFTIKCSYLEIYNERLRDLLADEGSSLPLTVRDNTLKGVFVDNLSKLSVSTYEEAMSLLQLGASRRVTASTSLNTYSSRSHSIFTAYLEAFDVTSGHSLRFSRLNLVDLAGSERQKKTRSEGDRLREASGINQSLMHLGHVIRALASSKRVRSIPTSVDMSVASPLLITSDKPISTTETPN